MRYSAINDRPVLRWPDDKPIAVWFAINAEYYELAPPPNAFRAFWTRVPVPDVMNFALRDFGNRVGMWRVLDAFDAVGVSPSISLNLGLLRECPEIGQAFAERDYTVFSHGLFNTRFLFGVDPNAEREWVKINKEHFEQFFHRELKGMFGPAGTLTPQSMEIWATEGIEYVVDWFVDDRPFPLDVPTGRLVNVTYSWEVNDARVVGGAGFGGVYESDEFVRRAIDQIECLATEGERDGRVACVALHPYIIAHAGRIGALEQILEFVSARSDVWLATYDQIAQHYFRTCYETELARIRACG